MIIIVPVEIDKRELIEKIFLSTALAKFCKAKIYLIKSHFFFKKIKRISDVILFDKGIALTKKNLYKKNLKNSHLISFDVESPIINWDNMTFKARIPNVNFKKTSIFFVQNIFEKKKVDYFFKKNDKVVVCGNPKFELSKKKNCKIIFEEEIRQIKKEFGTNYFLFSSSFSIDLYGGDKLWMRHMQKIYRFKNLSNENKKFEVYNENDKKNYLAFIDLAIQTAKAFPKKKIIFRPHPTQDINLVKKRFPKSIHNLHIIYRFHSTPWIFNCEYFFHTHCSTHFEAFLLKKKIIHFYRTKLTRHLEYFNLFVKDGGFNDYKDVINVIKKKKSLYKKKEKNNVNTYSFNSNQNSHKIIVNEINKKFKNINSQIIFNDIRFQDDLVIVKIIKKFFVYLKYLSHQTGFIFLLDYFFDLKPKFFLNKIIKDAKGSKLNKFDIDTYLNKTNKIYKSNVQSNEVDKNVFLIFDKKRQKK